MIDEEQRRKETTQQVKFHQRVMEDLQSSDLKTVQRDLQEIYQFYLDQESIDRLREMGPIQKVVYTAFWFIKSLFLKLTPVRRLTLLLALVLFAGGLGGDSTQLVASFLALLFILVLELKDKLLAQDELQTGRAVQLALLPERHITLPGWEFWLYSRPANEVGGDLVDALSIDDDRIGISLGDVSGKGLGAALFMAKLQSTLRAVAPDEPSVAAIGAKVNRIFCRDALPNRFASLVYLDVAADSGRVRLLNAGHLPPYVVRGDYFTELPKGNPAIGLMASTRFEEQEVDLDPGDLLLVYSDGLTEARNEGGVFFGDERLRAILTRLCGRDAEAAGTSLIRAVDLFMGDARPHDDLSLVVLRRLPTRPALPGRSVRD